MILSKWHACSSHIPLAPDATAATLSLKNPLGVVVQLAGLFFHEGYEVLRGLMSLLINNGDISFLCFGEINNKGYK